MDFQLFSIKHTYWLHTKHSERLKTFEKTNIKYISNLALVFILTYKT